MITVRILGGLGNQMFAYASAKAIARANKTGDLPFVHTMLLAGAGGGIGSIFGQWNSGTDLTL